MSKDSYWFRHDSTAGRGLKMRKIAHIYGHWGKGVYWDVVEMLRDTEDYEYDNDEFDLKMLADLIGCKDIEKFINWYQDAIKFGLLEERENKFYSPALKSVMGVWESKKINGSKGGRPKKVLTENKPNKNLNKSESKPNSKANQNHNRIEHNSIEYNSINKEDIDWRKLLEFYNKTFNKKNRLVNSSVKQKYQARIKEGYKKEDILKTMINSKKDSFHKDSSYKYCTLEYFSRSATLDKYGFDATKINSYIPTK
jgi:hypothetical protein